MLYSEMSKVYQKLDSTSKTLEMIKVISELFKKTPPDTIGKVTYLTRGELHPDWTGFPEIGIGENMASRVLGEAANITQEQALDHTKEAGGIGAATQKLLQKEKNRTGEPLTVTDVYNTLEEIAQYSGEGSQEKKVERLAKLVANATPIEAKYIMRTVIGNLRLGVGDMTILDGLAEAFTGTKDNRILLERAYNLTSDLGYVAEKTATEGLDWIREVEVTVGRPIRMMLAQKLPTAIDIVEKMKNQCSAEYKLDGERVQIHKKAGEINIFSRRLENITYMYPDVEKAARKFIDVEKAVVEGEMVAIDPATGALRPFQLLMQRRRKYKIKEMMAKIPVWVYLFDCLYSNGKDLTKRPYLARRNQLKKITKVNSLFKITPSRESGDSKEIERFFHQAISDGCEGLIVKSTDRNSIYQAGARSWRWIKLKRSYQSRLAEPVDLVIVGALRGRGKRTGTYGAVLAAAYDKNRDRFPTVCKVGSGWTDKDLKEIPRKLEPYSLVEKHSQVESLMEADVWFKPKVVVEVNADEITLSPAHPCGMGLVREDSGMALRFPRFTGRWRPDKGPRDATTVGQIIQMYKSQQKTIK